MMEPERLQELYPGQALWKMPLGALREQDKNARIVPTAKFQRLIANIAKDKRLRSMPLAVKQEAPGGKQEFLIISGHHRIRAAREAGIEELFVMVEENEMSRDEIVAEQLAQNSLQGYDDPDVLAELYEEIQNLDQRLASGLTEEELKLPDELERVEIPDFEFELDVELVNLIFVAHQFDRFSQLLDLLARDAHVYIADKADFDRFTKTVRDVSRRENIRNVAAAVTRMLDVVEDHYGVDTPDTEGGGETWVDIHTVVKRRKIPASTAKVINDALDLMEQDGEIGPKNRFQGLEYICADFLAGYSPKVETNGSKESVTT